MSPKAFYRYNPTTERYDRVYPSRRARVMAAIRQSAVGIVVAAVTLVGVYSFFEMPRERALRQEKEQIETQIDLLNRRADEALAVMEDLAARDNNFYRVMMQAEPVSYAHRYAGLERRRNYNALDSMSDPEILRASTDRIDRLERMIYTQSKSFDFWRHRLLHSRSVQRASRRYSRFPRNFCVRWLRAMVTGEIRYMVPASFMKVWISRRLLAHRFMPQVMVKSPRPSGRALTAISSSSTTDTITRRAMHIFRRYSSNRVRPSNAAIS